MRRALRRLTVGAAATTIALLALPPVFAKGGVDLDLGDDGGSANVNVEATSPGSAGDSSSGGGNGSGGGSSSGNVTPSGSEGKTSSGGGGSGGTVPVGNSGKANVGNYSNGPILASNPSGVGGRSVDASDVSFMAPLAPGYTQAPGGGLLASTPEATAPSAVTGGAPGTPAPTPPADQQREPEQPAAPQVDPGELAQSAVSQMKLEAPEIASTPNNPDTLGAVGLPVWFWVANPGETTTGPVSTSASAGAVTVNATATFDGMTITTGDGSTIECAGPGTEYPGKGIQESPDCGHVYEQMSDDQPDGLYTVDITAHWTVDWDSNVGASGEIPVDLTTSKQLRIGSYQTVVTGVS